MSSRSARNSRSLTPHKERYTADPEHQPSKQKNGTNSDDLFSDSLQKSLSLVRQSLELHFKISEGGLPQRCLSHNSPVSLYCTNEHKLVCVNCVYAESKHKSHKIKPIEQSATDIDKDIGSTSFRVAQKLNSLEEMLKTSSDNLSMMEGSRGALIAKLDRQFDEIVRGLSTKYLELKTAIVSYYEEMMELNRGAGKQLKASCQMIASTLQRLDRNDAQAAPNKNSTASTLLKHLALNCVNMLQTAGTLPRKDSEVEHLEIFAERQLNRLKNQLAKHRWLKFW